LQSINSGSFAAKKMCLNIFFHFQVKATSANSKAMKASQLNKFFFTTQLFFFFTSSFAAEAVKPAVKAAPKRKNQKQKKDISYRSLFSLDGKHF
jgi:hypothetical protein